MQIVVTGDVLRPNLDGSAMQPPNIAKLADELHSAGLRPAVLKDYPPIGLDEWLRTDGPTDTVCWHLSQSVVPIGRDTLVVGFELPMNALNQFDKLGIKYIDACIYPIRFCNTLYGIRANFELNSRFTAEIEPPTKFKCRLSFPKNSALIVGQTVYDRSLVFDRRLVKLEEFEKDISALTSRFCNTVFRPHPHSETHGIAMMRNLGIGTCMEPTYNLLAHPNISHVFGISSSVLYECKYFGKPSTFWKERKQVQNYRPVKRETFISEAFWKDALSRIRHQAHDI